MNILEVVRNQLINLEIINKEDEFNENTLLDELGADSVVIVSLIVTIEEEFDIFIPDDNFIGIEINSVSDLKLVVGV